MVKFGMLFGVSVVLSQGFVVSTKNGSEFTLKYSVGPLSKVATIYNSNGLLVIQGLTSAGYPVTTS